jgi:ribosomal protein S18 acetylase RimI-like enzyme
MQVSEESVTLRPATPDDEGFLLQVYAGTRSDELDGLGWDDNQKLAFVSMQFNAQRRCYPEADNKIILLNQRPIGRMLVDRTKDEILLVDIAILPEHRNAGVGTSLISNLLSEAAAAEKQVRLHVFQYSPAVHLYERLGFSTVSSDGAYLEMAWVPDDRSQVMISYRMSPYVHLLESHLVPGIIQRGIFHQFTGEVLEPRERVRSLLLAAKSGNRISFTEEDLTNLAEDGAQIKQLIEKEFLIPDGYDPLTPFVNQYVVRPLQNPALAYASETGEMLLVRTSMDRRVYSPRRDELPAIIEEKMTDIATRIFLLADGNRTLREIFRTPGLESANILEQPGVRQALDFLTSPERQLIKFTPTTEDLGDPHKPCNTVPRNLYHSSRWDSQPQESSSNSIIDFHLHGIEDAWWEFDLIETTVNHSLRFPNEALGGLDYGTRFCLSALKPELLPPLGKSDRLEVLEVGGGTGTFARSFIRKANRVLNGAELKYHILDLSPALIESQRKLLAEFSPAIEHFQQDATRFDIPGHRFDLVIANEVIADFPTTLVRRNESTSDEVQRWEGEGAYYLERYDLSPESAPDPFLVNSGAFEFIDSAWRHLSPGGTLIVSEYGSATRYPTQCYHLNHEEFSIHFGLLMACAQKIGFECRLFTLKEFLEMNDQVWILNANEEGILCLNHILEKYGMSLPYAVISKTEFDKQFQAISEQIGLAGVSFSPLRQGLHCGPEPGDFMVLIMTRPSE